MAIPMHMLSNNLCKLPAQLRSNIFGILGPPPIDKPFFTPSPNLKVQIFEFTYCNDRFPTQATNRKT
jgi:hypothetical protein